MLNLIFSYFVLPKNLPFFQFLNLVGIIFTVPLQLTSRFVSSPPSNGVTCLSLPLINHYAFCFSNHWLLHTFLHVYLWPQVSMCLRPLSTLSILRIYFRQPGTPEPSFQNRFVHYCDLRANNNITLFVCVGS